MLRGRSNAPLRSRLGVRAPRRGDVLAIVPRGSPHAPLKVMVEHVTRRARLARTDCKSVRRLPTCPTRTFIALSGPQAHGTLYGRGLDLSSGVTTKLLIST